MWFHIDPSSGTPIYLQIADQVNQVMAGGVLQPGQRLPATRDLAIDLAINSNMVVKAYQTLEREGLIELPRGRGAFVAASTQSGLEERLALLEPTVNRLVTEAYRLGCADAEVLDLIKKRLETALERRAMMVKEQGADEE